MLVEGFGPSSDSGVESLYRRLEEVRAKLAGEIWHQVAGLPFDVRRLEQLVEELMRVSRAICLHPEVERRLAVGAGMEGTLAERFNPRMGFSALKRDRVRCHDVQVDGKPVTLELWVKFLRNEAGASRKDRRLVFDTFLEQAPRLGPAIMGELQRFEELARSMGTTVQSLYEARIGLPWKTLRRLLEDVLEGLTLAAKMGVMLAGRELLGQQPAYYDCPWSLTFLGDRRWDWLLGGRGAVDAAVELLSWLGLEKAACPNTWDVEDRPHKLGSPLAWPVRIPGDVRLICPAKLSGFNGLRSLLHEVGYALFWRGLDQKMSIAERLYYPPAAAEVPALLLSRWIFCEAGFTHRRLGLNASEALKLRSHMLRDLSHWLVFDCVVALSKMDMWDRRLPLEEVDRLFSQRYQQHLGVEIPGAYWRLLPLVPEEVVGRDREVVASVLLMNLVAEMKRRHGATWLEAPGAVGEFLALLRDGGESLLSRPPDPHALLELFAIRVS